MTSRHHTHKAQSTGPTQGGRAKVLPQVLRILIGIAAAIAFFATALLSCVELVAYGIPGYFPYEFEKYSVYDYLPMDRADVDRVMEETMDYLRGDRERLDDVKARIDGVDDAVFYVDDEIAHMQDVREMFVKGFKLRAAAAVVFLICTVLAVFVGRYGSGHGSRSTDDAKDAPTAAAGMKTVLRTFAATELFIIAVCAAIAAYASTDFTRIFTVFHKIFFPQGNWEFDPARSRMINMLPEGLFSDTAMYIVIAFAVVETAAIAAAWTAGARPGKKPAISRR